MAIRSTGGFGLLRYEPGNPQFPTLPDGIQVPHVLTMGRSAGLAARAPVKTGRIFASAPADDTQRYAGWQTETTWVNPATVDFGVIPSPVQRTVSLYNARTTPVEVTALTLPSGVTLIDSLPVTLYPYAGFTFTVEAGTSGDNQFDEIVFFTTSEGIVNVRMLGRRVFTLENIPETPMSETLIWKTDILKSKDGSEKAYGLLYTPLSQVDYKVKFRNDLQRAKFKNDFIGGSSALVVAGQKWYEMRPPLEAIQATDDYVRIDGVQDASWAIGDSISIVSNDGATRATAQVDDIYPGPDINYELNVLHLSFDGEQGAQSATDLSTYNHRLKWTSDPAKAYIDTTQSVFGGASLYSNGSTSTDNRVVTVVNYAEGEKASGQISNEDFTIECWIRPQSFNRYVMSQWSASGATNTSPSDDDVRGWAFTVNANGGIYFTSNQGGTKGKTFENAGSPAGVIQLNVWQHIAIIRTGSILRCFVDGVQLGTDDPTWNVTFETGRRELNIGSRNESSYTSQYHGWIDEIRITRGLARYTADFTPPTAPFTTEADTYTELSLSSQLGTAFDTNSYIMPIGIGYVSRFPTYQTHALNLEEASYQLTFNQESDFSELDTTYFPTLTDLQSPENTLPVLDFPNELSGRTKPSALVRAEDVMTTGLANRIAFNVYPFADNVSEFQITLNNEQDVWAWRTFFHYLRGSYGEFFVPTFTNDLPGTTTAASNVFDVEDINLALNFGNPPDPRRNAIRLLYPNGNVYYRMITQVIDNVSTEEVTVDAAVEAGNPFISHLQRARILGDTVSFEHHRTDDVTLRFRFRTILL